MWPVDSVQLSFFLVVRSSFPNLSQMFPAYSGSRALPQVLELVDTNNAIGEDSPNLQPAPHGFDHTLQRCDVHIGAPFHLRDGRLIDAQHSCELFLGEIACFPQFIECHLINHFRSSSLITRSALCRHLCLEFLKVLSHRSFSPSQALPNVRRKADLRSGRTPHTIYRSQSCPRH